MLIPIDQIRENPDRIREDKSYTEEDFNDLKSSIKAVGQLQPILVQRVNGGYELVFGKHRMKAIGQLHTEGVQLKNVEPGMVNAELYDSMSNEMRLILEFEEQKRRKEFSWQEEAKYIRRFHAMFVERDPRWTQDLTAAALRLSPAKISYYLGLDKAMEEHPEVAKAATLNAAIKRSKNAKILKEKRVEALKDTSPAATKAKEILVNADAREWIKTIADNSIDLVNFDPPWGEEVSRKSAENWDSFDDSLEYADQIIYALLPEMYRILKDNSFLVCWYRQWAYQRVIEDLTKFGFSVKFSRTPWIWYKPDKVSDQNRFPEKQPIDAYETFILARKGDPVFNEKEVQNVLIEPRVSRTDQIHPTEKPVSLMERIIRVGSVPGARLLDPTAGSGAFLRAGSKLNRKVLGCELHKALYEKALVKLTEYLK